MLFLYPTTILSEVIEEIPSLIPVIGRFGIRLGLGDLTVKEICINKNVEEDFFLMVLNTFINEQFFPEHKFRSFHLVQIIDYLSKTNDHYVKHQIPNIEGHLRAFISLSKEKNEKIQMIGELFSKFKNEVTNQIKMDNEVDFPKYKLLSEKSHEATYLKDKLLQKREFVEESSLSLLHDIKRIMIKHLSGEFNDNLCHAVIYSIYTMEKDIQQHNRIRNRIMNPLVSELIANL